MAHAGGRPTKYDPEYCKYIVEYFSVPYTKEIEVITVDKNGNEHSIMKTVANDLPTAEHFCKLLGIHIDTLHEWKSKHPEFSEATKIASTYQKAMWQSNSLNGYYDKLFTIFMGKNVFGWADKMETTVTEQAKPLDPNEVTKMIESRRNKQLETDED